MEPTSAAIMAGGSLIGGFLQRKSDKASTARQIAFQREMSNTAYQRQMEDMRNAGLNPILAAKMGGASTPTGAAFKSPNILGDAVQSGASAVGLANQYNQGKIIKEDAKAAEFFGMSPTNATEAAKNAYWLKKLSDSEAGKKIMKEIKDFLNPKKIPDGKTHKIPPVDGNLPSSIVDEINKFMDRSSFLKGKRIYLGN